MMVADDGRLLKLMSMNIVIAALYYNAGLVVETLHTVSDNGELLSQRFLGVKLSFFSAVFIIPV